MYPPTIRERYALATTVEARSYSRNSGSTRWEIEIGRPSSSRASATACSLARCWRTRKAARSRLLRLRRHESVPASRLVAASAGRSQCFALSGDALIDSETEVLRDQANGRGLEPVVESGPRLAADGDRVFKTRRGYKCHLRSLALDHGIGADRRSMTNHHFTVGGNASQGLEYRLAGIRRESRKS